MINCNRPLDWTNISLQEYIDLENLLMENEEGLEQEDIILKEIQILTGRNPYTMQMPEFKKCIEELKFMQKEMPKMKVKEQYNLGGNIYFLHKKLEQFKVGQYIDYERIMKEGKGIDIYADFIALFLTPNEDDSYGDGYDVSGVVKDIRKYMSIADACSIAAFFFRQSRAFIVASLLSSRRKAMKAMKDRKKKKELRKKMNQLIKMTIFGESLH